MPVPKRVALKSVLGRDCKRGQLTHFGRLLKPKRPLTKEEGLVQSCLGAEKKSMTLMLERRWTARERVFTAARTRLRP